jgi:segregation and condensation protein A
MQLDLFLNHYMPQTEAAEEVKTVIASSFGATLEMAREGVLELQQEAPFAPLYVRRREDGSTWQRIG